MAGLRPTETDQMVQTFLRLKREQGIAILLIEHVMRAVMALASQIEMLVEARPKSHALTARWIHSF